MHLPQVAIICVCVCGYLTNICLLHSTINYRTVEFVCFLLCYITVLSTVVGTCVFVE